MNKEKKEREKEKENKKEEEEITTPQGYLKGKKKRKAKK